MDDYQNTVSECLRAVDPQSTPVKLTKRQEHRVLMPIGIPDAAVKHAAFMTDAAHWSSVIVWTRCGDCLTVALTWS